MTIRLFDEDLKLMYWVLLGEKDTIVTEHFYLLFVHDFLAL